MKYAELSVREKRSLTLGCIALGTFIIWQLVVRPVQSRLVSLNRIVDSKKQVLEDTGQMTLDLNRLQTKIKDLETLVTSQPNTGRILALLEQIQAKNGMDKLVTRMRPTTMPLGKDYEQISVNVELTDISLEKLIAFLIDIEAMNLVVGVQHLEVQQIPSSTGQLNVTLDLQTIVAALSP